MGNVDGHDIVLRGRKSLEITGVNSVESFDDQSFYLKTIAGPLQIQGSQLHMSHLDLETGIVQIQGTVTSFSYVPEQAKKKSMVRRLLR